MLKEKPKPKNKKKDKETSQIPSESKEKEENKRMTRFQSKRKAEESLEKITPPPKPKRQKKNKPLFKAKETEPELRRLQEMLLFGKFSSSKAKQTLLDLQSDHPSKVLEAVSSLSTELAFVEEGLFGGTTNLELFIPELIKCLKMSDHPEIMVNAASALGNILEISPFLSDNFVKAGAVSVLCEKMQNFEFVEIAENAVKTLEKISIHNALAILNSGGLPILLNLIDFFVSSVQKSITNIISNIFDKIPNEDSLLKDVFPILESLNDFTGKELSKSEIFCNIYLKISQKIMKFAGHDCKKKKNLFETIFVPKIIETFFSILNKTMEPDTSNSHTKHTLILSLIRILKKTCFASAKISLCAFKLGLLEKLDIILNLVFNHPDSELFGNILFHTVLLINSVLGFKAQPHPLLKQMANLIGIRIMELADIDEKLIILKENRDFFQNILNLILPRVHLIYDFTNKMMMKYIVLIILEKLLNLAEKKEFINLVDLKKIQGQDVLQILSRFLRHLMNSEDLMIVSIFVLIMDILLDKYEEMHLILVREGALQRLSQLSIENQPQLKIYPLFSKNKRQSTIQTFLNSRESLQKMDFFQFPSLLNRRLGSFFTINEEKHDKPSKKTKEELENKQQDNNGIIEIEEVKTNEKNDEADKVEEIKLYYKNNNIFINLRKQIAILAGKIVVKNKQKLDSPMLFVLITQLVTIQSALKSGSFSDGIFLITDFLSTYGQFTEFELQNYDICNSILENFVTKSTNFKLCYDLLMKNKGINKTFFEIFIENLLIVLESVLQNKLNINFENNEGSIEQDFSILSNREKVQVKFVEKPYQLPKSHDLIEKLEYLQGRFKEIPSLLLTAEAHHTLEVFEDYLLTSLNERDSFSLSSKKSSFLEKSEIDENDTDLKNFIEENEFSEGEVELNRAFSLDKEKDQKGFDKLSLIPESSISDKSSLRKKLIKKFWGKEINYKKNFEIDFYLQGQLLSKTVTIYSILQKFKKNQEDMSLEFSCKYKENIQNQNKIEEEFSEIEQPLNFINFINFLILQINTNKQENPNFFLMSILETLNIFYLIIKFQSFFIEEDQIQILLNEKIFKNEKISQILMNKSKEPLTVAAENLPETLKLIIKENSFLLGVGSKISYLKNFCQHKSRVFNYIYQQFESSRIGKLRRKKIKIYRTSLLNDSLKISSYFQSENNILEFEFFDEEGSGSGPTLEYYSLLASELKNSGVFNITSDMDYFPSITDLNEKSLEIFEFLGLIIARSIIDERILDFPLNNFFWKFILNEKITLNDYQCLDKEYGGFLKDLKKIKDGKEIKKFKGINLEDLAIFFVFPGSQLELKPKGSEILLDLNNIDEYLCLFWKTLMNRLNTVKKMFLKGFNKIFEFEKLKIFQNNEINSIYTGSSQEEYWTMPHLYEFVVPNYGYSHKSESYLNFIKILNEFNIEERNDFLMFVTGAAKLPLGGFKTLSPRLTIVKKTANGKGRNDDVLISVMTCQNYVKLPEYTTFETMKQKVLFAIKEGRNNFSLS